MMPLSGIEARRPPNEDVDTWRRFMAVNELLATEHAQRNPATGVYYLIQEDTQPARADWPPAVPVYTLSPAALAAMLVASVAAGEAHPAADYFDSEVKVQAVFSVANVMRALEPPDVLEGWARYVSLHAPDGHLSQFTRDRAFAPAARNDDVVDARRSTAARAAGHYGLWPLLRMTLPVGDATAVHALYMVALHSALRAANLVFLQQWPAAHAAGANTTTVYTDDDFVRLAAATYYRRMHADDAPRVLSDYLRARFFLDTNSHPSAQAMPDVPLSANPSDSALHALRIGLLNSHDTIAATWRTLVGTAARDAFLDMLRRSNLNTSANRVIETLRAQGRFLESGHRHDTLGPRALRAAVARRAAQFAAP